MSAVLYFFFVLGEEVESSGCFHSLGSTYTWIQAGIHLEVPSTTMVGILAAHIKSYTPCCWIQVKGIPFEYKWYGSLEYTWYGSLEYTWYGSLEFAAPQQNIPFNNKMEYDGLFWRVNTVTLKCLKKTDAQIDVHPAGTLKKQFDTFIIFCQIWMFGETTPFFK